SLRLLAWWRGELESMDGGLATHPVFVALRGTAERHALPEALFNDLIRAFEQDQVTTRYQTWEDLFGYCRYSANPVGRLLLRLCGYADERRDQWSDATCTALQLANFWQDVTVDLQKGRVYLPLDVVARHGYSLAELEQHRFTPSFRDAMREAVDVAQGLFERGLPLVQSVNRRLAFDLGLFSRGGMRVLQKIRARDYNVLSGRPAISKWERLGLLLTAVRDTL
ncbi:MAG: squalene synthase HpnC, partial [Bryobacteraceae bacterium]